MAWGYTDFQRDYSTPSNSPYMEISGGTWGPTFGMPFRWGAWTTVPPTSGSTAYRYVIMQTYYWSFVMSTFKQFSFEIGWKTTGSSDVGPYARVVNSGTAKEASWTTSGLIGGVWHWIEGRFTSSTDLSIWMDGVQKNQNTSSSSLTSMGGRNTLIGAGTSNSKGAVTDYFDAVMGHVCSDVSTYGAPYTDHVVPAYRGQENLKQAAGKKAVWPLQSHSRNRSMFIPAAKPTMYNSGNFGTHAGGPPVVMPGHADLAAYGAMA